MWVALACLILAPIVFAAASPLQSYRSTVYIIAGLAGVAALALLLMQPLLAAGYLPGMTVMRERRLHRLIGSGIVLAVGLHIGGLYLTSPPDTMDALLLVSPTPFSVYGVIGMWGIALTALLVLLRTRAGIRYGTWRLIHNGLAAIVVGASVAHALMIDGTMKWESKLILCFCVVAATGVAVVHLRILRPWMARR